MAYTKTTWATGDTITEPKLSNLETQYDKARLLENNEVIAAKQAGGATIPFIVQVDTNNDLNLGRGEATGTNNRDVFLAGSRDIYLRQNGVYAVKLVQSTGFMEFLVGAPHAKYNSPRFRLDRNAGAGQFALVETYDGATLKADWGYDYTLDEFVVRDASANKRFRMLRSNGFVISDNAARCKVYNSANQSITTATATVLTFDTEDYDNDTMHSTVSNTSRITLTTGGRYLLMGKVQFASNATGTRRVRIVLNGITVLAEVQVPASNVGVVTLPILTVDTFAAADYVELEVYQDSGGALNAVRNASYTNYFLAEYLGPS